MRSISPCTQTVPQLPSVATAASGRESAKLTSASTQCVCAVWQKVDTFLQRWSITYNRIVVMKRLCGVNQTGRHCASRVTIKRHGQRIRILSTPTEQTPWGQKPLNVNILKTGAPSHAQKRVFKRPIAPSDIKITKKTDNNYI